MNARVGIAMNLSVQTIAVLLICIVWHTPDEGNPGHRLGELQPNLPDVGLLITSSNSKNLCNVALHELFGVSCLVLDPLLLLRAGGRQRSPCQHKLLASDRDDICMSRGSRLEGLRGMLLTGVNRAHARQFSSFL